MKGYLKGSVYYIEDDSGNVIFSVSPDNTVDGNQIIIETKKERFAGPVDLLSFASMFNDDWDTK